MSRDLGTATGGKLTGSPAKGIEDGRMANCFPVSPRSFLETGTRGNGGASLCFCLNKDCANDLAWCRARKFNHLASGSPVTAVLWVARTERGFMSNISNL